MPCTRVMGRGCTAGFYRHPQRVEEGTRGIISRTDYENPCIFRQYSSPSHSPTTPTLLTSKPDCVSTSGSSKPYRRPGRPCHAYVIFKDPTKTSHVLLWKNAMLGALQSPHVGPCKVLRRDDTTYAIGVHGVATTVFVGLLNPAYVIQPWSRFTSNNSLQHNSFRTAITLSGLPVGTADSPWGGVMNATYYSCHKEPGHNIRKATCPARSLYCPKGMIRCSLSSRRHNSLRGTGQATSAVRILYCLEINFTTCV